MQKYYHFTSYDNVENISENGLIPQIGLRSKTIGDEKCAVFLSKGMDNAIHMYSSISWEFSQSCGDNAKSIIKDCRKTIEYYLDKINNGSLFSDEYQEIVDANRKYIELIKPLVKIKTFEEYIGDGCYLSVSGIKGIVARNQNYADCYYEKVVPPKNIKVVTIKDKKTKEIIDEREKILTYFMSNYEPSDLFLSKDERNAIAIRNILDMYDERTGAIYGFYNYHNYELEEVPIKEYVKKKEMN